jgi:hypothetical protein
LNQECRLLLFRQKEIAFCHQPKNIFHWAEFFAFQLKYRQSIIWKLPIA